MSSKTRKTGGDDKDTALELLGVIKRLLEESATWRRDVPLTLDASLERDLGFDSLARVELVARLEQHFSVALPDDAFAEVETPRELLRAIGEASGPRRLVPREPLREVSLGEAEVAPRSAETLADVLKWHVENQGDRPHLQLYTDSGDGEILTYNGLWQGAEQVAAGLQALGVAPRQGVALILPTGRDYFFAFFGILLAGAVPVPIYPPARPSQIEDHLKRHAGILNNCQAVALIANNDTARVAHWLRSTVTSLRHLMTVERLMHQGDDYEPPAIGPADTAFLQYTSGSTGQPKGVVLSHANLLANIRAMGQCVEVTPDDVFVSWLPLYHDMGLIGAWLSSLYFAVFFVVMSPVSFLASPQRWLWAMHRHGGTLSASPNFGYELCLHRVGDHELDGLDLGRWRAAFNGAEGVSPTTLERFCERYEDYGFKRSAMMPVYGLAESSVALAMPPPGREPVIDCVDRRTFAQTGKATQAAPDDENAIRFPACGRPLPGHEIRIVDENRRELPDRQQGRIQFCGPSATSGYCRNPEASRELFDGQWLNTGDLGYTVDGDIYITGREKDIVIRAGRNIYPGELEELVGDLDGVRKGRVAVFGSIDSRSGTERLIVLAETRLEDESNRESLRNQINELALECLDGPPDDIVLAPAGSLLKTSSGKIRREAIRKRYEKGEATRTAPPVWRQWLHVQFLRLAPAIKRLRQRAGEYGYAVWVWSCYGLMAPFVWIGLMVVPRLEWRWALIHRLAHVLSRMTATPVTVHGRENVITDRPCVLVANHQSYLDAYVMVHIMPFPARFTAKAELGRKLSTSVPLRRLGCVFVERFDAAKGTEDARKLVEMAASGDSLAFFPEGTFTRIPGMRQFHMGAFMTAVEAGVPVVPVTIRGTRHMLRSDSWFPRRGRISVRIDKAVDPNALQTPDESTWQTAVKLRDRVRSTIVAGSGEPDLVG